MPDLYINLYHGRKTKDEELDDWGMMGPTFGPYDCIQITYGTHIKMYNSPLEQMHDLYWSDDLVYYDGMYYGDFDIVSDNRIAPDEYDRNKTRDPNPLPTKVWLLAITHKHGVNTYLCWTEERARQELHQYVQDNWNDVCPEDPMPENPEQAITDYFEATEKFEHEFYSIELNEIL